ncbi:MAG: ABC transporter permease [Candidatus Heimdallarchaeota archaeon]|nr:ABC transporter permease [Candidatus Heimdallarchaeota archaeon]
MAIVKKNPIIAPFKTLWNQIKFAFTIQIAYPIDFFGQIFTALFVGMWFIFFAIAVSGEGSNGNVEYIGIGVWGIVAFFFYSTALWSVGRYIRREQLTGTLESVWMTATNKIWVIICNGIGGFLIFAAINTLIVLGFAMFVPVPLNNFGLGMLVFFLELIQSIGFGLLYAALVMKIKNANAINNLVNFSLLVLSAVFFPFAIFPQWMLWISRLVPFSWIVDAARSSLSGTPTELITTGVFGLSPLMTEILIIIGINIVLLVVGTLLFIRATRKARIDGSLSQY